MTPEKQVSFMERVEKSILGLEGLQIVVYCDRNRFGKLSEKEKQQCTFAHIGKKLLAEINGEYIKKKYNIQSGIELGNRLHQERVKWLKNIEQHIDKN